MRRPIALLCCALFVLAPACVSTTRPPIPPEYAPHPNTPANALRRLEWSWDHRNCDALAPLFTDDYRFVFGEVDSAGNLWRDDPWTREDELAASCNLFQRAADVDLDFPRELVTLPDERPGRNPRWHKTIRTAFGLRVAADLDGAPQVIEASGHARFFFVRGDSALIPPDLVARGFGPDSTRWWIERWEDESLPAGAPGAAAHPAWQRSWGGIKALFR